MAISTCLQRFVAACVLLWQSRAVVPETKRLIKPQMFDPFLKKFGDPGQGIQVSFQLGCAEDFVGQEG